MSEYPEPHFRDYYIGGRSEYDPEYTDDMAARRDWDAYIARVRRDAWDEGFQDGRRYDGEGDDGPRYINPYSGQDADQ